jgi:hypothetical protein
MKIALRLLCATLAVLAFASAQGAEESFGNNGTRYYGTASADNQLLFTTGEILRFGRGCMLMSPDGAVDVEGTLDGTNWTTTPITMQDLGAVTVDPVAVTAPDRMYYVPGFYRFLRVRQNGATATSASLYCKT